MSFDGKQVREEARACHGKDSPAGELVDCVAKSFPDVEVYREMDDLVIKGDSRYLSCAGSVRIAFMSRRVHGRRPRISWMPAAGLSVRSIN